MKLKDQSLETLILENLFNNEEYSRKILPFLKPEYFENGIDKCVFNIIFEFINKFNALPPKKSILQDLKNTQNISQDTLDKSLDVVNAFEENATIKPAFHEWIVQETEKFCQERAIYLAITDSIQIMDGRNTKFTKNIIPQLLSDALAVSFDSNLGHDYFEDATKRYDFIHRKEPRIPFDLDYFNRITRGGVTRKTLNIIVGGINVGKTLCLCHLAASYAMAGYKVLYISAEMSEESISERLDGNILDTNVEDIFKLSKNEFTSKINNMKLKTKGNVRIKEYPTGVASVANFRSYLRELKIKSNFVPDVILVDYLGIIASSRIKLGGSVNTYTYFNYVAQELRGLAIEYNVPVWSAAQLNRSGFASSDPDLDDTAESFAIQAVSDFTVFITETEELEGLGQYLVKQGKNRYNRKDKNRKFIIGVNKEKMKLYDVNESNQNLHVDKKDKTVVSSKSNKTSKFKDLKV